MKKCHICFVLICLMVMTGCGNNFDSENSANTSNISDSTTTHQQIPLQTIIHP